MISEEYLQQNIKLHEKNPGYGTGGHLHTDEVLAIAKRLKLTSILDYGCGKGTLLKALRKSGFKEVKGYDPASYKKYRHRPQPADLVVCTDVLEHIEKKFVLNVLSDIYNLAHRAGYLSIATRPSNKTLDDGRNAHLSVHHPFFWMNRIRALGWRVVDLDAQWDRKCDWYGLRLWLEKGD